MVAADNQSSQAGSYPYWLLTEEETARRRQLHTWDVLFFSFTKSGEPTDLGRGSGETR